MALRPNHATKGKTKSTDKDKLKQEMTQKKSELGVIVADIKHLTKERDELEVSTEKKRKEYVKIEGNLKEIEANFVDGNKRLNELLSEITAKEDSLQSADTQLSHIIKEIQTKTSEMSQRYADMLIKEKERVNKLQNDFADLSNNVEVKKDEARRIEEIIHELNKKMAVVNEEIKEKEDMLTAVKDILSDEKVEIQRMKKEYVVASQELSHVQQSKITTTEEISVLQKEREVVNAELQKEKEKVDKLKKYRFDLMRRGNELKKLYEHIADAYRQANIPLPMGEFKLDIPQQEEE